MNQRVLIVNANDFGRSPGVNQGVTWAYEPGVVTSATLMVRWPAAVEAAAYARRSSLSVLDIAFCRSSSAYGASCLSRQDRGVQSAGPSGSDADRAAQEWALPPEPESRSSWTNCSARLRRAGDVGAEPEGF